MSRQELRPFLLLDGLKSGSAEAFDEFYDRYVHLVYHVALKLVKEPMEAEDICHDVFLEALIKIEQYDPSRGSLESWLATKTRSRCLDRLRKKQLQQEKQRTLLQWSEQSDKTRSGLDHAVLREAQKDALYAALQSIPDSQREAIYGMYFDAHTQRNFPKK